MRRARNLPLSAKLMGLTLLICGAALVAALAACFGFLFQLARSHERDDLNELAQIIAANAVAQFEFHDAGDARALLATLGRRPEIVRARLLDAAGRAFATYDRPGSRVGAAGSAPRTGWARLTIVQPVQAPGEPALGRLELQADISGAVAQLLSESAIVFVGILAGALAIAWVLGSTLQREITRPILALADLARRVTETHDYSLRVAKSADDEVGRLTDAFNRMLAEQEGRRELEKQLEQAQRLESLGVLAGGIAHDFNNILTGILCSASLAKMEVPAGAEAADHLLRIETSSRRAAELCEQMLAYAGKNRAAAQAAVHFNTLIRETLELLHASVPKDAELDIELEPDLPYAAGDPSRVRQVIMNLVINAGEALQDPPRRIVLSTRRANLSAAQLAAMSHPQGAVPGEFVLVSVADTGVGIPPEQLARIFEPFYTSKFTGRGLGLSSVLGIMRASGGALDVSTEVGRGTTFTTAFPVVRPPADETVGEPDPGRIRPAAQRGTVLVVDDEESVRAVAEATLRRMGYEVLSSDGGAAAVKLLAGYRGQLHGVLLDVTMPGMDGAATLQELRRIRPDLKAILMSGYDEQASLRRFQDLGVGGFLHKPFSAETLSARTAVWE